MMEQLGGGGAAFGGPPKEGPPHRWRWGVVALPWVEVVLPMEVVVEEVPPVGGGGGGGWPAPQFIGWSTSVSSSSLRSVKSRSLMSSGRLMDRTNCSHCTSLSAFHSKSGIEDELVCGSSERKSDRERDAASPSFARLTAPAVEMSVAGLSVVLPLIRS
ncbi:hypothetical protein MTO96_016697 [Rhipicephalus appendiculatus]